MAYGGRTVSKFEHARRLAAALAYLAISQRDAVGLVTFDTAVRALIPPRSAPGHFSVVCRALEETRTGGETPLSGILHALAGRIRRRALFRSLERAGQEVRADPATLRAAYLERFRAFCTTLTERVRAIDADY